MESKAMKILIIEDDIDDWEAEQCNWHKAFGRTQKPKAE